MSFLLLLAVGALAVVALAKVRAAEREIARLGERVASLHDEIAILRAPPRRRPDDDASRRLQCD